MNDTIIAIGLDRIINTADTITVFAMQIGVTRIGAGGRVLPRCRNGAMTSVTGLVAQEGELQQPRDRETGTEIRPLIRRAPAVLARTVVALAAAVVALPLVATLAETAALLASRTWAVLASRTVFNAGLAVGLFATLCLSPVWRTFLGTVARTVGL